MKKMLGILLVLVCMSAGSAYGAALEISCGDCANAVIGSQISCTVSLNSTPEEVESFGFDLLYDPDVLSYISFTRGALTQDRFDYLGINEKTSGHLRIGGAELYSNPLPVNTSGEFLLLTFQVKANGDCGSIFSNLADDFGCWPADPPIVPEIPEGQAFRILENSKNGKFVGAVVVDKYTASSVDFSITGGNTDNVFTINNFGVITVQNTEPLNYINKPEYLLNIRASVCDNTVQDESVVRINITPLKGNVNIDDSIDLQDAILSLKTLTGIQTDSVSTDADVNNDNRIGMEETIYILRDVAGIQ